MTTNPFKKYSSPFTAAVICFIFSSLSSPVAFAQDFSSIDNDLVQLDNLIAETLTNTQEQQKLRTKVRWKT